MIGNLEYRCPRDWLGWTVLGSLSTSNSTIYLILTESAIPNHIMFDLSLIITNIVNLFFNPGLIVKNTSIHNSDFISNKHSFGYLPSIILLHRQSLEYLVLNSNIIWRSQTFWSDEVIRNDWDLYNFTVSERKFLLKFLCNRQSRLL